VLIACMPAAFLMAIAISDAFGERAGLFVGGSVALQWVRNTFVVLATDDREPLHVSWVRMWIGSLRGLIWIAGAIVPDEGARTAAIWIAALVLDYGGPLLAVPPRSRGAGRANSARDRGAAECELGPPLPPPKGEIVVDQHDARSSSGRHSSTARCCGRRSPRAGRIAPYDARATGLRPRRTRRARRILARGNRQARRTRPRAAPVRRRRERPECSRTPRALHATPRRRA
jgi:hypothetical protein